MGRGGRERRISHNSPTSTHNTSKNPTLNHENPSFSSSSSPPISSIHDLPSINDLKLSVSSRIDALLCRFDQASASVVKEMQSSSARLVEEIKIGKQSCSHQMGEIEIEYKSLSVYFKDIIQDVQGSCSDLVSGVSSMLESSRMSLSDLMKTANEGVESLSSSHIPDESSSPSTCKHSCF